MEEAEIKICEVSGEEVDVKVRLDVLKKEEQMIAEENEELLQEEEEKKRKVCSLIICTQVQQTILSLYLLHSRVNTSGNLLDIFSSCSRHGSLK